MLSRLFRSSVTSCRNASRSFAIASRRALASDGGGGEGESPCCDRDRASPRATAEDMECGAAPFACAVVGESGCSSSTSSGSCDWTFSFYSRSVVSFLREPAVSVERRGVIQIVRPPRPDHRPAPLASHGRSRLLHPRTYLHSLHPSSCSSSSWTWRRRLQFGQSKIVLTSQIAPDRPLARKVQLTYHSLSAGPMLGVRT